MVVLDAHLPMDESLDISEADIDLEKFSSSRLRPGWNPRTMSPNLSSQVI